MPSMFTLDYSQYNHATHQLIPSTSNKRKRESDSSYGSKRQRICRAVGTFAYKTYAYLTNQPLPEPDFTKHVDPLTQFTATTPPPVFRSLEDPRDVVPLAEASNDIRASAAMSLATRFMDALVWDDDGSPEEPAGDISPRLPTDLVDMILDIAFPSSERSRNALKTRSMIDRHQFDRHIRLTWRTRLFYSDKDLAIATNIASSYTEPFLFNIPNLQLSTTLRSVYIHTSCSIALTLKLFGACPNVDNIAISPSVLCHLVNKIYGRSRDVKLPRRDMWHLTTRGISIMVVGAMDEKHWNAISATGEARDVQFCKLVTHLVLFDQPASKPTSLTQIIFPRLAGVCPVAYFPESFITAHSASLTKKVHLLTPPEYSDLKRELRDQKSYSGSYSYHPSDGELLLQDFLFHDRTVRLYTKSFTQLWYDFANGVLFQDALKQMIDLARQHIEEMNFNHAHRLRHFINLFTNSQHRMDTTDMDGECPVSIVKHVFIAPSLDAIVADIPMLFQSLSPSHIALSSRQFEHLFGLSNHHTHPSFLADTTDLRLTILNEIHPDGQSWGSRLSHLVRKITRLCFIGGPPARRVSWRSFTALDCLAFGGDEMRRACQSNEQIQRAFPRHHPSLSSVTVPLSFYDSLSQGSLDEIESGCDAEISFEVNIAYSVVTIEDCVHIWDRAG